MQHKTIALLDPTTYSYSNMPNKRRKQHVNRQRKIISDDSEEPQNKDLKKPKLEDDDDNESFDGKLMMACDESQEPNSDVVKKEEDASVIDSNVSELVEKDVIDENKKNEINNGSMKSCELQSDKTEDEFVCPKEETRDESAIATPNRMLARGVGRFDSSINNSIKKNQSTDKTAMPKSKKGKDTEQLFQTTWICFECKEAECMMNNDADELLICDGLCQRLFHYPCAGLQKLPSPDEDFICNDCRNQHYVCSFCQSYGIGDEDVFKCTKNYCGLFFHERCLQMQNVDVKIIETKTTKLSNTSSDIDVCSAAEDTEEGNNNDFAGVMDNSYKCVFVCPAHACWTCNQKDLKEQEKNIDENKSDMEVSTGSVTLSSAGIPMTQTKDSKKIVHSKKAPKLLKRAKRKAGSFEPKPNGILMVGGMSI